MRRYENSTGGDVYCDQCHQGPLSNYYSVGDSHVTLEHYNHLAIRCRNQTPGYVKTRELCAKCASAFWDDTEC